MRSALNHTLRSTNWRPVTHRLLTLFLLTVLSGDPSTSAQDSVSDPAATLTTAQQEKLIVSENHLTQGFEYLGAGKLKDATTEIKAAIAIDLEVCGNGHDRVLANQATLADLLELQEQFTASQEVHIQRLAALTKRYGKADWRVVDGRIAAEDSERRGKLSGPDRKLLQEAGEASRAMDQLYAASQFSVALEKSQFIVQRRRELLGEHNSTYALSLAKLALVHSCLGAYDKAESLYDQALVIEKETLGELHPEYATTLSNLAVQCDNSGEYVKAGKLYQQAMEIRRQTLGERSSDYATSLNNLAVHFDLLGDFAKAEPLHRSAVELKQQILGEQHPDSMTSLNNLGRSLLSRGELEQAEPILIKAMELRKQVLGEQHAQYAGSLNSLGLLYSAQRDFERAERMFQQAREILKKAVGELHSNYGTTLGYLADVSNQKGDFVQAEKQYREVLTLRQQALGEQHPDVAAVLSKLSLSLLHQEKIDEARTLAIQAAEINRRHVEAVASVQSDRQQFVSARQSFASLDALLSILVRSGRATDIEYNEILQAKGRVWQRQRESRETARASTEHPELAQLIVELRSLAAGRAQLVQNVPRPKGVAEWQRRLTEVTEQQESRERELSEKSVALREARTPVSPADVRKSLPEGTVLVDVFEYLHVLTPPAQPKAADHERRLVAFIVRRDTPEVTLVSLGPVKPLSKAIDTWREYFGRPPEQAVGTLASAQAAGRLLRQKIWEPLEPHLGGAGVALVSPDGLLGRFPLMALPGKSPDSYLLEEVALAVIPCAMAIPRIVATDGSSQPTEVAGNLLIAANIDYNAVTPAPAAPSKKKFGRQLTAVRGSDWKGFKPLGATRGELASIDKLYRDSFGGTGITLLEGTEAREQRFCEEAIRHKYLHIATHGFFAPTELRSAIKEGEDQARSAAPPSGVSGQFIGYPPGLLSGLAFAGANGDPEPDCDDGILTASEVENLDLGGVQLAVLSACETGLGEVAGGEGQLGLQRAFQVAGAQTVVASLWPVSDTETRTLMERFYENLLKKDMGRLDALREAQLWMLREGQERGLVRIDQPAPGGPNRSLPFYWAPFVLSGDWQ